MRYWARRLSHHRQTSSPATKISDIIALFSERKQDEARWRSGYAEVCKTL